MKLKIFLYSNDQYKLLEDELNKLGKKGYLTNNFSFITLFKKTDKQVRYYVDLFQPTGRIRAEKYYNTEVFLNKYLENDYKYVGRSDLMHVFVGEKELNIENNNEIKGMIGFRYLLLGLFFLLGTFYLFLNGFISQYLSTYLTTGSILLHYMAYFLFIFFAYYFLRKYSYNKKINKRIKKLENKKAKSKEKIIYKINNIIICVFVVLIAFGLINDNVSRKSISISDHKILTLNDLNIDNTSLEYKQTTGLFISNSYICHEKIDNQYFEVSEYYTKHPQYLLDKLLNNPLQILASSLTQIDDTTYKGSYNNNECNAYIIIKDNCIITISSTFDLTPYLSQINEYYKG
jgi:hypothetical protein